MKPGTHPTWYPEAVITCACGTVFVTGSTKKEIHTDVCSQCHPFFTGEQRIVDTAGQVERFMKRAGQKEKIAAAHPAPDAEAKPAKKEKGRDQKPVIKPVVVPPAELPLAVMEEKPALVASAPEPPVIVEKPVMPAHKPEPMAEVKPIVYPAAPAEPVRPTPVAPPAPMHEPEPMAMEPVAESPKVEKAVKTRAAKPVTAARKAPAKKAAAPKKAAPKAKAAAKPKASVAKKPAAKKPAAKKKK